MSLTDEASSLLLYQFNNSPKLKGLVRSLVQPLQTIADGMASRKHGFHVDEASEHWLDVLGHIIGQSRFGVNDDDMRAWIKIRIIRNRYAGTEEELLSLMKLLLGESYRLTVIEYEPKDVFFVFFGKLKILSKTVFSLLKDVSPVGIIHYFIDAEKENPFELDGSPFSSSQLVDFFPKE